MRRRRTPRGVSVRQLHPLYHRVVDGLVARARLRALDRVDRVHPVRHLAEHRVLAVEPRRGVGRDDEELRAVRARPGGGHGQRAAHDLVVVDLVLERVPGAARAGARRVAALDHEVLDHAVEDHAVVEPVAGELAEVLHGHGRAIVEELDLDRAVVRVKRCAAHLLATSRRSSTPRTLCPLTFSTTSPARSPGTSTKEKRSSTRTFDTSSPSRCELWTIAATTSAGSRPRARPTPNTSLARGSFTSRRGFVWRRRRGWRSAASACGGPSPLVATGAMTSSAARSGGGGGALPSVATTPGDHGSIVVFACLRIASRSRCCFGVISVIARPERPTRPVRPIRCTYTSGEFGMS